MDDKLKSYGVMLGGFIPSLGGVGVGLELVQSWRCLIYSFSSNKNVLGKGWLLYPPLAPPKEGICLHLLNNSAITVSIPVKDFTF
nr:hypothetical protein [uncultured Acetobacteroides sp.]